MKEEHKKKAEERAMEYYHLPDISWLNDRRFPHANVFIRGYLDRQPEVDQLNERIKGLEFALENYHSNRTNPI